MNCYVLELKKVHGTRVANADGMASIYYTSATHDVLQYAAPNFGEFVRAVAVQADNIDDAMKLAIAKITETSDVETK